MAAYFIAQYQVNDAALYAEYGAGAGPTVAQYGGEVLVFDVAAETTRSSPRLGLQAAPRAMSSKQFAATSTNQLQQSFVL